MSLFSRHQLDIVVPRPIQTKLLNCTKTISPLISTKAKHTKMWHWTFWASYPRDWKTRWCDTVFWQRPGSKHRVTWSSHQYLISAHRHGQLWPCKHLFWKSGKFRCCRSIAQSIYSCKFRVACGEAGSKIGCPRAVRKSNRTISTKPTPTNCHQSQQYWKVLRSQSLWMRMICDAACIMKSSYFSRLL